MKKAGIRQFQLQWQYFISYLAVMLVVMVVLLTYTFQSSYRFHSQILLEQYENGLNMIRETNESTITGFINICGQISRNNVLSPFVFREKPEKCLQLNDVLSGYKATSDAIEGIYIHFYKDDYVYGSASSYLTERFVNEAFQMEDVTPQALLNQLDSTDELCVWPEKKMHGYLFVTHVSSEKEILPIFIPLTYTSGVHWGTALFVVDHNTYTRWFNNLISQDADVYVMQENKAIVSHQELGVPFNVMRDALAEGQETLTWQGQTYHLITKSGNTFPFSYVMLVSDNELRMAMSSSVRMLIVVGAVVAAFGLLVITRVV